MNAIEKYNARAADINSLVCVGLDSDTTKMKRAPRQLPQPQYAFNRRMIDQTHPYAAAYKFNMAFYEARGEAGLHDLLLSMNYLRENIPTFSPSVMPNAPILAIPVRHTRGRFSTSWPSTP